MSSGDVWLPMSVSAIISCLPVVSKSYFWSCGNILYDLEGAVPIGFLRIFSGNLWSDYIHSLTSHMLMTEKSIAKMSLRIWAWSFPFLSMLLTRRLWMHQHVREVFFWFFLDQRTRAHVCLIRAFLINLTAWLWSCCHCHTQSFCSSCLSDCVTWVCNIQNLVRLRQ